LNRPAHNKLVCTCCS